MKKNLWIIVAALVMSILALSCSAITLDTAETPEESAMLFSSEIAVPDKIDEEKGKLVLYQSFDEENAVMDTVTYKDDAFFGNTSLKIHEWSGLETTVVANETFGSDVLKFSANDTKQYRLVFQNVTLMTKGDYTLNTKTMVGGTKNGTGENGDLGATRVYYTSSKFLVEYQNPYHYHLNSGNNAGFVSENTKLFGLHDTNGVLTLSSGTKTAEAVNGIHSLLVFTNNFYNDLYLDDVALYCYPDNAFIFKNGSVLEMVEVDAEKYTFVKPSAVSFSWSDAGFYAWTDGENTYLPGMTADSAELYGKTLTAVFAPKPLVDAEKGKLVYYQSFEEDSAVMNTLTYVDSEFFGDTELRIHEWAGLATSVVTNDALGSKALKISTSSASDYKQYRVQFRNAALMHKGDYTLDSRTVVDGIQYGSGENGDLAATRVYTTSSNFIAEYQNPYHYYLNSGNNIGKVSENTKKFSLYENDGVLTLASGTKKQEAANGIHSFIILNNGFFADFYIDDVALYYYPENAATFLLSKDSEVFSLYESVSESAFVFPTPEALGFDVDAFDAWTNDGVNFYEEGSAYDLSLVSSKIFYPVVYESPKTVDAVSIRTTAPGGIRFAAFVDNRTKLKTETSEYGFIIALQNSFVKDENDEYDYSTLVFPEGFTDNENKRGQLENGRAFVYGYAYNTDPENYVDKVYSKDGSVFGDDVNFEDSFEDGGIYYTCVLYGFNGYEQYSLPVVVRPYIKIGERYFYGNTIVRNIYDVALKLYENGMSDNEYLKGIVESKP